MERFLISLVCVFMISVSSQSELGSKCSVDKDCEIEFSRCSEICKCQPYYAEFNSTTCLKSTLLDHECYVDEQCSLKVANSVCSGGICRCSPGFLRFRRHTCLGPAKPGDVCYSDEHCHLWSKSTRCEFLIPNLFGRCRCEEDDDSLCRAEEEAENGDSEKDTNIYVPTTTIPSTTPTENNIVTSKNDGSSVIMHEKGEINENSWNIPKPLNTDYDQTERVNDSSSYLSSNAIPETISTGLEEHGEEPPHVSMEDTEDFHFTTEKNIEEGTQTKLKDTEAYQGALKLLSTAIKNKWQASTKFVETTTNSFEAKYREELEEMLMFSSLASKTPAEASLDLSKELPSKLIAKQASETKTRVTTMAISIGLPCASDMQCQASDRESRCIQGICDCVMKENGTESCGQETTGCSKGTFQCRSSGICVSWFFVCDGRKDCADGSDEECGGPICPQYSFQCGHRGICVSRSAICDGVRNCPDGEDEQYCSLNEKNKTLGCPKHTFQCANGQCIPEFEFCNAIPVCKDGSDEPKDICRSQEVEGRRSISEDYCPFRCGNGRCRSTAIVCSGRDGCGDNSDEQQCKVCTYQDKLKPNLHLCCPKIP